METTSITILNFYKNKLISELDSCIKTTVQYNELEGDKDYTEENLKRSLVVFYMKKLRFLKAYEVIEDICVSCLEDDAKTQAPVFKHCFLLNFFSCSNDQQRRECIEEEITNVPRYAEFVGNVLKILEGHKSKFIRQAYEDLKTKVESDPDFISEMKNKTSATSKRIAGLTSKAPLDNSTKDNVKDSKIDNKSDDEYKHLFRVWLHKFIKDHLSIEIKDLERQLFVLDSKDISKMISPDIQGNMAHSLMHSGENLQEYTSKVKASNPAPTKTKEKLTEKQREEARLEKQRREAELLEQDITKLMDGYKDYGKDIDVNEWYKSFKTTLQFREEFGMLLYFPIL